MTRLISRRPSISKSLCASTESCEPMIRRTWYSTSHAALPNGAPAATEATGRVLAGCQMAIQLPILELRFNQDAEVTSLLRVELRRVRWITRTYSNCPFAVVLAWSAHVHVCERAPTSVVDAAATDQVVRCNYCGRRDCALVHAEFPLVDIAEAQQACDDDRTLSPQLAGDGDRPHSANDVPLAPAPEGKPFKLLVCLLLEK